MKGVLRLTNISPKVAKASYPLREILQAHTAQITPEVNLSSGIPPMELLQSNRCNPHVFGQPHLTFNRQVLSGLLDPALAKSDVYPKSVQDRIHLYLNTMGYPLGAYSGDNGYDTVINNVAKFLERRDGHPVDRSRIYLTEGVTRGMDMVLKLLIQDSNDKILVPAPAAPLYGTIVPLRGGQLLPYDLNEEGNWTVDISKLQQAYDEQSQKGSRVKAICVINPGNPTGKVLSHNEMRLIVDFAYKNKLVIIADEVLQDTVYEDKLPFISFKKVIYEDKSRLVDLFSFHSASNALQGEGGFRAGFFEAANVSDEVNDQLRKLKTMYVCSNTVGQIAVDLMVNAPSLEMDSEEVVKQYEGEKLKILNSLKSKAKIVNDALKDMKYVTCNEIKGGIYGFPQLKLSQKAIREAHNRNMEPDTFYTTEAYQQTGAFIEPGSVFGQKEGTYHYRISTLMHPEEALKEKMDKLQKFNKDFHKKYN